MQDQRIREGVCPAYSRSRLQDLQTNERGNALQEWRRPENWAVSRAGLIRNLAGDVVDGESSVTILNLEEWACAPSFCKRKNRALGRLVARGHLTPEAAALWFRKNTEAAARELEHKQNEEDGHATRRCPKSGPVPRAGLSQEWACPKSGLVQNILGLSQEWACPKRHLRWVFTALFFLGIRNYSSQAKSNAHP